MSDTTITSVRNPRVQAAAGLRERRERDRQQRILIDGERELARALDAGVRAVEVFHCLENTADKGSAALLARLAATEAVSIAVAPHVFQRVAYGERSTGLVAVAETPDASLNRLKLPDIPLIGVIEGCEKPGNLGAVLRSADAAGLSAVIVADGGTDLFNPNVIRASLGTVFTMPVAVAPAADVLQFLRAHKLAMIAARVDANRDYTQVDYRTATAIILGSEAHGLSTAWHAADVIAVRLPMLGVADSLNVSATAAVLFYEALRQRT
ncbi:MAG TPA: TrmH family RNA methyltransferase [Pirellulales bacterium]